MTEVIALYCDDHEHPRQEIGRLVHDRAGWSLQQPASGYRSGLRSMVQLLTADGKFVHHEPEVGRPRVPGRVYRLDVMEDHTVQLVRRYRLACTECGPHNRVTVRDDAKLDKCLRRLTDNGISEVSLRVLHSALRHSAATM